MITLQSKGELLTFRPELTRFLLRNDESAGNVRSRRRARPGNPYLEGALGIAAISISHTRNAYLSAKSRRIAARWRPLRATVAIWRALLVRSGVSQPPKRLPRSRRRLLQLPDSPLSLAGWTRKLTGKLTGRWEQPSIAIG